MTHSSKVSEFALLEIKRRVSIDVLSVLESIESAYISEISICRQHLFTPPSSASATSERREPGVQCVTEMPFRLMKQEVRSMQLLY